MVPGAPPEPPRGPPNRPKKPRREVQESIQTENNEKPKIQWRQNFVDVKVGRERVITGETNEANWGEQIRKGEVAFTEAICNLGYRIAGVASVGGSMTPNTYETCSPNQPTAIVHIHGIDDTVVPIDGNGRSTPLTNMIDYWKNYNTCDEETIFALPDLNDDGYNFGIGLSNIGPIRLKEIIEFLAKREKKLHCVQVQFSLLAPDLDKQKKVQKICDMYNIDFLAYSPLSFGLLCKDPTIDKVGNTSLLRNLIFNLYDQSTLKLRLALLEIANNRSVSQAQVAINWCCYQGAIPLVGLRNKDQLIDIAGVLKWDLSQSEFQTLNKLSREIVRKLPSNPFVSQ